MRNTLIALPVLLIGLLPLSYAESSEQKFDAICLPSKKKCKVYLNPQTLRIDEKGQIKLTPIRNITSWRRGGKGSRTALGRALISPVFLFQSSHEYIFTINYLNEDGISLYKSILFKNKKPSDRFTAYLSSITGLSWSTETNRPMEVFNQKKAIDASNNIAINLRYSSLYSYNARCNFYMPSSCLTFPISRPFLY
ncbi:hypothetical protein [Prochlorococcus marinus]|uniref:hypothetical protein n=1 Tax=Prochlorococcus marinus TaxID=1219 RepID=UPI0022B510D0|nr:hypothetical protein [Prochlorococcus marinus]